MKSLDNRPQQAARLYDEAIYHAKANKNILLEALANYAAAGYYSDYRKIAKAYAKDACRLFEKWGAIKIAERVGKLYGLEDDLAAREVSAAAADNESTGNKEQSMSKRFEEASRNHQKEIERLGLEEAYVYFLDTVCEETGADIGAILLEEGASIRLEYLRGDDKSAIKLPTGVDLEEYEHLPKKVVRYTGRTFEEVIIGSKPVEGPFANDDYFKDRPGISVVCIPLKYNDIFFGIVYLESRNNNRFNAVTAEYIKSQSFYLIAKQALERESGTGEKMFVSENVKGMLTRREMEVLHYMALGMSNKEIAEKLHISSSTVKTHTLNLYDKLEVRSRIQAVTKAKALGLI